MSDECGVELLWKYHLLSSTTHLEVLLILDIYLIKSTTKQSCKRRARVPERSSPCYFAAAPAPPPRSDAPCRFALPCDDRLPRPFPRPLLRPLPRPELRPLPRSFSLALLRPCIFLRPRPRPLPRPRPGPRGEAPTPTVRSCAPCAESCVAPCAVPRGPPCCVPCWGPCCVPRGALARCSVPCSLLSRAPCRVPCRAPCCGAASA